MSSENQGFISAMLVQKNLTGIKTVAEMGCNAQLA